MDVLARGEKQIWHDELMRTGCESLWDSIFFCFGNYRNADNKDQKKMILEKLPEAFSEKESVSSWIQKFRSALYDAAENLNTDRRIFFALLSLRFLEMELFPFLKELLEDDLTESQFKEELKEKVMLLAEHRLKKKAKELTVSDVEESIDSVMEDLFSQVFLPDLPVEKLSEMADVLGYNIVVLSEDENKHVVLYDSISDKDDNKYKDTIVVRFGKDRYESIGRLSNTKDGHKKLSRIFSFDDSFVHKLRTPI